MASYDELYDKIYNKILEKGIRADDCELDFGDNTTVEFVLRDPESGADVVFEIDMAEYFGSVHDIPGIEDNIEYYADMDELAEMRADNMASEYASEHEDEDEEEEAENDE